MTPDAVVLLSGGVDSAVCAHMLTAQGYPVKCVFIDFGQPAARLEQRAATAVSEHYRLPLRVVRFDAGNLHPTGEIPGRNAFLVFSALLASDAASRLIALGIHEDSLYYDCSRPFREALGTLVSECTNGRTQLVTPLFAWTKREIVGYAHRSGIDLDLLYSCEAGSMPACGRCASCREWEGIDVR